MLLRGAEGAPRLRMIEAVGEPQALIEVALRRGARVVILELSLAEIVVERRTRGRDRLGGVDLAAETAAFPSPPRASDSSEQAMAGVRPDVQSAAVKDRIEEARSCGAAGTWLAAASKLRQGRRRPPGGGPAVHGTCRISSGTTQGSAENNSQEQDEFQVVISLSSMLGA